MLVLGIESATPVASAALVDENGLLGEVSLNIGLTHSEQLLPMIDDLLRQCGRSVIEITGIGVSAGPGSYTGLRIGVATAKALAQGAGALRANASLENSRVCVIPISTLEVMAWAVRWRRVMVAPALNARKGQIYAALYEWRDCRGEAPTDYQGESFPDHSGEADLEEIFASRQRGKRERAPATADGDFLSLECLIPPRATGAADWAASIGALTRDKTRTDIGHGGCVQHIYFLGDGACMYKELWERELGSQAIVLPPVYGLCRGAFVALAASGKAKGQNHPDEVDFYNVKPVYLRGI